MLFAALNVATGECHHRHRQQEFLKFLDTIDAAVPAEEGVAIHYILDNYGTHKSPRMKRWLAKHPGFVVHSTPTSGSWLNHVERFFAEFTEKKTPGFVPQREGIGEIDRGLLVGKQQGSEAVHVDGLGGIDPEEGRGRLQTNFQLRTLVWCLLTGGVAMKALRWLYGYPSATTSRDPL